MTTMPRARLLCILKGSAVRMVILKFQLLNGGESIETFGGVFGGGGSVGPGKLSGKISMSWKKRLFVIPMCPWTPPADSGPLIVRSKLLRTIMLSLRVNRI